MSANELNEFFHMAKIPSPVSTGKVYVNFEVRGKKFKPGWYTLESPYGINKIPTYCFVYADTNANVNKINNSGLMLELFKELPANATVNAHRSAQPTEEQKHQIWLELKLQEEMFKKEKDTIFKTYK